MGVPIALEYLARIIHKLLGEKLAKLRIAGLHLLPCRPAVIRQIITTAARDTQIDQCPESAARRLQPSRTMRDMQVENNACVAFLGPAKEALFVLLYQPDGAIDHVGFLPT